VNHSVIAVNGTASRKEFTRLEELIGVRTLPLQLTVDPLADVAEAQRRVERGHVVGKIVLRIHEG